MYTEDIIARAGHEGGRMASTRPQQLEQVEVTHGEYDNEIEQGHEPSQPSWMRGAVVILALLMVLTLSLTAFNPLSTAQSPVTPIFLWHLSQTLRGANTTKSKGWCTIYGSNPAAAR